MYNVAMERTNTAKTESKGWRTRLPGEKTYPLTADQIIEISELSARFGQWLEVTKRAPGITRDIYAHDSFSVEKLTELLAAASFIITYKDIDDDMVVPYTFASLFLAKIFSVKDAREVACWICKGLDESEKSRKSAYTKLVLQEIISKGESKDQQLEAIAELKELYIK